MKKYKGYIIPMGIPKDMSRERLLAVLEDDHCYLPEQGEGEHHDPPYCDNLKDCGECIFYEGNRLSRMDIIVQYGIDQGFLSKAEGLKYLLDKSN